MKILSIDDMIEAADAIKMPGLASLVRKVEAAATDLAQALAGHLGIEAGRATYEGGSSTCACFGPTKEDDPCPEVIDKGDEGGEWEPFSGHFLEGYGVDNSTWDRDDIQFPRLIEEAQAAGAFTPEVIHEMAASMDLVEIKQLHELLDRAAKAWEAIKEKSCPPINNPTAN